MIDDDAVENNAVIDRLRSLTSPVDEGLAAQHERLMAMIPATAPRRRVRTMVAGGTLVAAMFAGTGIAAAAGNLPGPLQRAAHSTLAKVGVDVPKGVERSTEGCNGKTYKNHGQFMKDQPKGASRAEAAKSMCGKPVNGADADENTSDDQGKPENPGKSTEDHGKPADAGSPSQSHKPADAGAPDDKPAAPAPSTGKGAGKGKGRSGK